MLKVMRQIAFSSIVLLSLTFAGCGPSKELLSAQAKTDSLEKIVAQQNNEKAQLNTELNVRQQQMKNQQVGYDQQIASMKVQYAIAMQEASDCKLAKEAVARRMEEFNQALAAQGLSMKEIRRK